MTAENPVAGNTTRSKRFANKLFTFILCLAINGLAYSIFRAVVDRLCSIDCVSTYVLSWAPLPAGLFVLTDLTAAWLTWRRNRWLSGCLWFGLGCQIVGYALYYQWFWDYRVG